MTGADDHNGALVFAQVGGPPADWQSCRVIDLASGTELRDAFACDVLAGWADVYERNADGRKFMRDGAPARKRITGRFKIERSEVSP